MTPAPHAPAFYNEIEPYLCTWLNHQIAAGLIPPGRVDGRDIRDLDANDLAGYRQVHLFAGVGGWAYAARLAGWSDDAELWSASCPCQPFSVAGKRGGTNDPRHLWPTSFGSSDSVAPPHSFASTLAPLTRHSSDGEFLTAIDNRIERR